MIGQTLAHKPQAVHFPGSIRAVIAGTLTSPLLIRILALDAAADACVTESLISLGPSAAPARKTPPVVVSTGRNLGGLPCKSRRYPWKDLEAVNER